MSVVANDICTADVKFGALKASYQGISKINFCYGNGIHLLRAIAVLPATQPPPSVVMYMPGKVSTCPTHVCKEGFQTLLCAGLLSGRMAVVQLTTDTNCSLREVTRGPLGEAVRSGKLQCCSPLTHRPVGLLQQWSPREFGAYASLETFKTRQKGVIRGCAVVTCYFFVCGRWSHPDIGMSDMQTGVQVLTREHWFMTDIIKAVPAHQ